MHARFRWPGRVWRECKEAKISQLAGKNHFPVATGKHIFTFFYASTSLPSYESQAQSNNQTEKIANRPTAIHVEISQIMVQNPALDGE